MNPTVRPATPRDGRDRRWDDHRAERRRSLVEATLRAVRQHGSGAGHGRDRRRRRHVQDRAVPALRRQGPALPGRHRGGARADRARPAGQRRAGRRRRTRAAPSPRRSTPTSPSSSATRRSTGSWSSVPCSPAASRRTAPTPSAAWCSWWRSRWARPSPPPAHRPTAPPPGATPWSGMVRAVADAWIDSPSPAPRHEVVEHLVDLAWDGLAAALPHPVTPRPRSPRDQHHRRRPAHRPRRPLGPRQGPRPHASCPPSCCCPPRASTARRTAPGSPTRCGCSPRPATPERVSARSSAGPTTSARR